jgi:hypothetical protein
VAAEVHAHPPDLDASCGSPGRGSALDHQHRAARARGAVSGPGPGGARAEHDDVEAQSEVEKATVARPE